MLGKSFKRIRSLRAAKEWNGLSDNEVIDNNTNVVRSPTDGYKVVENNDPIFYTYKNN